MNSNIINRKRRREERLVRNEDRHRHLRDEKSLLLLNSCSLVNTMIKLFLAFSIIVCVLCPSRFIVNAKMMKKGGGGGEDWEAYPTEDKCNCNCGGGGGKTKVIAMEKVIKVPRIRIIDMGKKDDLHYSKSKSMVGMVMASPDIEMMDDEPMMDPWSR